MARFIPRVGDVLSTKYGYYVGKIAIKDYFYVTEVNSNRKKLKGKILSARHDGKQPPLWKDAVKSPKASDYGSWVSIKYPRTTKSYGVATTDDLYTLYRRDLESSDLLITFDFHQAVDISRSTTAGIWPEQYYTDWIKESRKQLNALLKRIKARYSLKKRKNGHRKFEYIYNSKSYGKDAYYLPVWEGVILPRDSEDALRILKELGKLVERDKMTRGDYVLGESFFIRCINLDDRGEVFSLREVFDEI
jgi:hypothetical protein